MTDVADRLYEKVLVLRAQLGDEPAFAELVQRYDARLHYFLAKMFGETHRAEDALQEVWLDAWRSLPRLAEAGAWRAWLYRIARDRAHRELRKRRVPMSNLEACQPANSATDDKFSAEDLALVRSAIDRLTPEQREAVLLRYMEGMSYDEIASVTGCQVGTVRSRLHYAKVNLKQLLAGTMP
ncbi:MAG TPA: sigma-70 family RNA polymerase sigma factor [Pirellulaceae bacterium]|nr:sigma-70 family RNA polymerase sigma factor [Pirellulaceae bacterium]